MPDRLVRRLNGPRGTTLAAYGVVAVAHAGVYAAPGHRPVISMGLDLLDEHIPPAVPAVLWGMVAFVALVGAVTDRHGAQRDDPDAWGFGGFACLASLWGISYLLDLALERDLSRLAFGVIYLSCAVGAAAAARMTNPQPRYEWTDVP